MGYFIINMKNLKKTVEFGKNKAVKGFQSKVK